MRKLIGAIAAMVGLATVTSQAPEPSKKKFAKYPENGKRVREFKPKKTNQKIFVIEGVEIEALNHKNAVRKYKKMNTENGNRKEEV